VRDIARATSLSHSKVRKNLYIRYTDNLPVDIRPHRLSGPQKHSSGPFPALDPLPHLDKAVVRQLEIV
jgi:hypothetical protein